MSKTDTIRITILYEDCLRIKKLGALCPHQKPMHTIKDLLDVIDVIKDKPFTYSDAKSEILLNKCRTQIKNRRYCPLCGETSPDGTPHKECIDYKAMMADRG